jgi:hypothetical protein
MHQHWYTSLIALSVRRNPQHRSFLAVVSATVAPPFQPLRHLRDVCHAVVNSFTRQTLLTVNRKHAFMNIICSFAHKERTTESCSLLRVVYSSDTTILIIETSLWACAWASATYSWTVLLPSDTHRKPITSITAVLVTFVAYLLTLPRSKYYYAEKGRGWKKERPEDSRKDDEAPTIMCASPSLALFSSLQCSSQYITV